mmetsp:Transcript_9479/g.10408  ORF Transcript_9479/g.10408 Transcript_9479/m.10408 type:complete len:204 (-) Transcript_9479:680-1291(-)
MNATHHLIQRRAAISSNTRSERIQNNSRRRQTTSGTIINANTSQEHQHKHQQQQLDTGTIEGTKHTLMHRHSEHVRLDSLPCTITSIFCLFISEQGGEVVSDNFDEYEGEEGHQEHDQDERIDDTEPMDFVCTLVETVVFGELLVTLGVGGRRCFVGDGISPGDVLGARFADIGVIERIIGFHDLNLADLVVFVADDKVIVGL